MPPNQVTAEKTLFDVLRDLWRGKFYMVVFAIIMLALAFIFMSFAQNFYRAEMVIAPASHMGQGSGINKNSSEGTIQVQPISLQSNAAFMRFENIYDGVSVAKILVNDKKIIDALKFDRNFEFSKAGNDWNTSNLSEYLNRRVKLESLSGTPLQKLTYLHPNKDFAAYMISRIHELSDKIIRGQILAQVNGRIKYLNKSLSVTNNPEHRRNLTALLMEQERIKMLASIDQPYAATVIEPPYILSKPSWPDPYVIYPVFLFVGLLLGFVVYGIRHHE